MYYDWKPYVTVAERRRKASRAAQKLRETGKPMTPVVIAGHVIARTFWGKAWCDNLERYSDYSNRLPRGRAYVRNGSVIDLTIAPGEVMAQVSGSSIYTVRVAIAALPTARWNAICADCAGAIESLIELLQGRFTKGVMERICRRDTGLFPAPKEIKFTCSCPDWATMCKHVAAVLYGVGARLDHTPELLFALRQVDHKALIATAGHGLSLGSTVPGAGKVLEDVGLAEMFGIELAVPAENPAPASAAVKRNATKKLAVARAKGRTKEVARETGPSEAIKGKRRAAATPKRAKSACFRFGA